MVDVRYHHHCTMLRSRKLQKWYRRGWSQSEWISRWCWRRGRRWRWGSRGRSQQGKPTWGQASSSSLHSRPERICSKNRKFVHFRVCICIHACASCSGFVYIICIMCTRMYKLIAEKMVCPIVDGTLYVYAQGMQGSDVSGGFSSSKNEQSEVLVVVYIAFPTLIFTALLWVVVKIAWVVVKKAE